jgi:outer membrane murein-binding lipoprotein Lpp
MAVENQVEGTSADGGADANQTPSKAAGKPLGDDLTSKIDELQRKLDAQAGEINALKSGKDKAVDRVEKSVQSTIEQLANYLNVSPEQVQKAQREQVLDALVQERMANSPEPAAGGTPAQQGLQVEKYPVAEAIALVEKYQLPTNDPEFITLLRKNPTEAQVKDYVLQKKAPPKEPDTGDFVQSPLVTPAASGQSLSQLEAAYQKEMSAIASTLKGNEKVRAITVVKEKYRGLGLAKY